MMRTILTNTRRFITCARNPYFVTTPIFYVNASPHIGHLYSAVIADAVNRYMKLRFPEAQTIFSTGTDEHGTKVQQAASANKAEVGEYCNKISGKYKELFHLAGVEYTDFIRTTEERHKNSLQHFWNALKSGGHIYSTQYKGWYCVSDEVFLTESQLKENPDGSKVSSDSGHHVTWTEEENYMFRLSALQNDVINWIKSGDRIKPVKFEKILLDYLDEPLPDVSISRPASRVHWGIPVPEDDTQNVYVWLDALVNYLTCAGYPNKQYRDYWPPSLQVIGKDILKFHGIYWPAFLIAVGIEPPKRLMVHSHWTVDGQKMSKSKFNVVDPMERGNLYTMEGLRYFLLREGVAHSDSNYSDVKILRILNSELADTLGNLLSRGCAKSLNPRQMFPKVTDHHLYEISKLDSTKRLLDAVSQLPEKCAEHYEKYNFYLVVDQVMTTLHAANNFFESSKPWELRKHQKGITETTENNASFCVSEDILKLETIISITMDTLRKCAIILQPIIPDITKKLLDKLGVTMSERSWEHLKLSVWDANCTKYERCLGEVDAVLFRRIILADDKKKVKKSS